MNNKYQIELDEFNKNFKNFKHSPMVLYGIGRYTATLVEGFYNDNAIIKWRKKLSYAVIL